MSCQRLTAPGSLITKLPYACLFLNPFTLATMNTFVTSLILSVTLSFTAFATPVSQPSRKDRPTKLARYQTGTYITADGTKLRVNIDKQLGGRVDVQLNDLHGTVYFDKSLSATETNARLSLNLTELTDGDYVLKISNGLEMEVREIRITTRKPIMSTRSITIL